MAVHRTPQCVLRAGVVECRLVGGSGRREGSGGHLWRRLGLLGARAVGWKGSGRAGRKPTGPKELSKLGVNVGLPLKVPLEVWKPVVCCGSGAEGCNCIGLEAGHAGENIVVAEQCGVSSGKVVFLLVHFLIQDDLLRDLEGLASALLVNLGSSVGGLDTGLEAAVTSPRGGNVCPLLVLRGGSLALEDEIR